MIIAFICGGVALILIFILILILLKSGTGFNEIDKKFGKPYEAKLIKMIGGHSALRRGAMAISFHPKDAIAFNRKVFPFSQISSIKIISKLPKQFKSDRLKVVDSGEEPQYLCLEVTDEDGKHEVVFTAPTDFENIANKLIQKWNKYNLLS